MIHNFSWLLPGRLAGFGLALPPSMQTLAALNSAGVGALVSLTEMALDQAHLDRVNISYLHLPIVDMRPPTQEQMDRFVDFVDKAHLDGRGVAVHCRAGLGRTGTMLAAYLIHQGSTCEHALDLVRRQRPGSVETVDQEEALRGFARGRQAQVSSRA